MFIDVEKQDVKESLKYKEVATEMKSDWSFFKDNLARMIYSISHDGQNQSSYARRSRRKNKEGQLGSIKQPQQRCRTATMRV